MGEPFKPPSLSAARIMAHKLCTITDNVFLAGVSVVSDTTKLHDANITHVLNVARELEDLKYPEIVKDVRKVSLYDSPNENILPFLDELADYIHEVTTSGGRIVVHCIAGVSRSATVCIGYLMKHQAMTLKEAHDHVKKAREVIYPNRGFWAALVEFEYELKGYNTVELMPYVSGMVPSIESYKVEMMHRMRLGWMDYVFYNIFCHAVFFVVQMISVQYFIYDS